GGETFDAGGSRFVELGLLVLVGRQQQDQHPQPEDDPEQKHGSACASQKTKRAALAAPVPGIAGKGVGKAKSPSPRAGKISANGRDWPVEGVSGSLANAFEYCGPAQRIAFS